jgi:DNA primase
VAVLTLPPGEDPDTLVARGGAAAFRALMGEAVDLFERKLQLLDRKGLFGTLEGRRRALDRLLPTIRAAADPITRELYTSRAAERSGVGKAVLEQEVQKGDRRSGAPPMAYHPADGDAAAGAAAHRVADRLAALPPDIPQERSLVELMVRSPSWVERAMRDGVTADQLRHPLYREIAAGLLAGSREPPADDLAPLWEALARPPEGEFDAEAQFSAAVQWLRERPLRERLHEIDRLIALAEPEAQEALMREKSDLRGRIEPRYGRKAFRTEREPA